MEYTVHDSIGAGARVRVDALERNDERVVHQIVVDHAVEDINDAVLTSGREQRQPPVDGN